MRAKSVVVMALVLGAACTPTSAPTPAPSAGGTSGGATAPVGARTLRKGETQEVDISAGQTHEWAIDLAAGEAVRLTMRATSASTPPCTNWTWGFFNPSGGTLREEAMGPYNSGGNAWTSSIDGTATPSIVEGPMAGRYHIRVSADPTSCPALRYTLRAE